MVVEHRRFGMEGAQESLQKAEASLFQRREENKTAQDKKDKAAKGEDVAQKIETKKQEFKQLQKSGSL